MKQRFTWKKAEKLKSRKRIESLFREGSQFSLFPFRVFYQASPLSLPDQANSDQPLQAGFGASKRNFKKSVDRNRIKRVGREAYRLQKQPLIDHLRLKNKSLAVFFVYVGKELPVYESVKEKIAVALQKLITETT